jgi:hypothetical protein
MAANIPAAARASRRFSSRLYSAIFAIHARSAPAQKDGPAPPMTTARNSRSAAARPAHAVISAITCSLNAFRTSGRKSVTYSTFASRDTWMVEGVLITF